MFAAGFAMLCLSAGVALRAIDRIVKRSEKRKSEREGRDALEHEKLAREQGIAEFQSWTKGNQG